MIKKCVLERESNTFWPEEVSYHKFYVIQCNSGAFSIVLRCEKNSPLFKSVPVGDFIIDGEPWVSYSDLSLIDLCKFSTEKLRGVWQFDTAKEMFQFLADNMEE